MVLKRQGVKPNWIDLSQRAQKPATPIKKLVINNVGTSGGRSTSTKKTKTVHTLSSDDEVEVVMGLGDVLEKENPAEEREFLKDEINDRTERKTSQVRTAPS